MKVVLPFKSLDNQNQLAIQLKPNLRENAITGVSADVTKRDSDFVIFEIKEKREYLVEFLNEYASGQEDEIKFIDREEFVMDVKGIKSKFKFSGLENLSEKKCISGYVEIKQNT